MTDSIDPYKSRLIVLEETEYTIKVTDGDKQSTDKRGERTYYKTRGRPLPFEVQKLRVIRSSGLAWPPKNPLPELPTIDTVLSGRARIWHYNGLQLMNDWSDRTFEVDVEFSVPTDATRKREEEWCIEHNLPAPHGTFATTTFIRNEDEESGETEIWIVRCWLTRGIFDQLVSAVMNDELRALTFGVSGEYLYLDDWVDPSDSLTGWYLRSDEPNGGYSRGSLYDISFVTGEFEVKKGAVINDEQPTQPQKEKTDAMDELHLEQITQVVKPLVYAVDAARLEIGRLTAGLKWLMAIVACSAVALLLK